jgi:hypothetical protein
MFGEGIDACVYVERVLFVLDERALLTPAGGESGCPLCTLPQFYALFQVVCRCTLCTLSLFYAPSVPYASASPSILHLRLCFPLLPPSSIAAYANCPLPIWPSPPALTPSLPEVAAAAAALSPR